jgi:nucleotide-binding universal stress UspA family protein
MNEHYALHRVVVGVDFSAASIEAATWVARHVAPAAEIVLVHVLDAPSLPSFLAGLYPQPKRDALLASARVGALERLRALGHSLGADLVRLEVRVGKPDEEIVRAAEESAAALIVVARAATASGVLGRIGTTAQRVLRRASVPVLLAAGALLRAPSRVLVAVDDSEMTAPVLAWGRALAGRFDAEASVMHVVTIPLLVGASTAAWGLAPRGHDVGSHADADDQRSVREAERWLVQSIERSGRGSRITASVIAGHVRPADAILEQAARADADLIVLGSSGADAVPRLLLGSVSEAVLRGAPCPVFVVVPPGTRSQIGAGGARRPQLEPFDVVADASMDSFPASDSPPWTGMRLGPPR